MDGSPRGHPSGKLTQLVFYLERYGDELEADFLSEYHGLNLGKLLRSGQHARILRLIHQLPQASRFNAAVASDPEHVEAIIKATEGQQQTSYHPPLAEWRTENEQLATVADLLQNVIAAIVATNGGKPPKVKPMPRPKTEFDAARERSKLSNHRKLVARVLRAGGK